MVTWLFEFEGSLVFRGFAVDLDPVDLGSVGTGATEPHHAIDLIARPLDHSFDPTIGQVADPADDALLVGLGLDGLFEALPLNVSLDEDVDAGPILQAIPSWYIS
jgi:pyridoxal biosynthesis lyase PdxS